MLLETWTGYNFNFVIECFYFDLVSLHNDVIYNILAVLEFKLLGFYFNQSILLSSLNAIFSC